MRKAIFSPCEKYRFTLWREWGNTTPIEDMFEPASRRIGRRDQFAQFICLNPSTATDAQDDPTVRRCVQFCKDWGFGGFCMTNLFAFRATDPREMMAAADPVGPGNDDHILRTAAEAGVIVAAWGALPFAEARAKHVLKLLELRGFKPHALRKTYSGAPSHPLYLPGNLFPTPYALLQVEKSYG